LEVGCWGGESVAGRFVGVDAGVRLVNVKGMLEGDGSVDADEVEMVIGSEDTPEVGEVALDVVVSDDLRLIDWYNAYGKVGFG
jgi:hypothetical protein